MLENWVNGGDKARTYVFDIDETVELFLNGLSAKFGEFRVGDRIGGRIGFIPDVVKDPKNPDSKNYRAPKITVTPEGFSRVIPEHLRVSRPIEKGASQFIRERARKADDIIKANEAIRLAREAKKREKEQEKKN